MTNGDFDFRKFTTAIVGPGPRGPGPAGKASGARCAASTIVAPQR